MSKCKLLTGPGLHDISNPIRVTGGRRMSSWYRCFKISVDVSFPYADTVSHLLCMSIVHSMHCHETVSYACRWAASLASSQQAPSTQVHPADRHCPRRALPEVRQLSTAQSKLNKATTLSLPAQLKTSLCQNVTGTAGTATTSRTTASRATASNATASRATASSATAS